MDSDMLLGVRLWNLFKCRWISPMIGVFKHRDGRRQDSQEILCFNTVGLNITNFSFGKLLILWMVYQLRVSQTQLQYYIKYTIGVATFRPLRAHLQAIR
jgi:hypothetical protein